MGQTLKPPHIYCAPTSRSSWVSADPTVAPVRICDGPPPVSFVRPHIADTYNQYSTSTQSRSAARAVPSHDGGSGEPEAQDHHCDHRGPGLESDPYCQRCPPQLHEVQDHVSNLYRGNQEVR